MPTFKTFHIQVTVSEEYCCVLISSGDYREHWWVFGEIIAGISPTKCKLTVKNIKLECTAISVNICQYKYICDEVLYFFWTWMFLIVLLELSWIRISLCLLSWVEGMHAGFFYLRFIFCPVSVLTDVGPKITHNYVITLDAPFAY